MATQRSNNQQHQAAPQKGRSAKSGQVRGKHAAHAAPAASAPKQRFQKQNAQQFSANAQGGYGVTNSHNRQTGAIPKANKATKQSKKRRVPLVLKVLLVVVLVAALGVGGFFAWNTFLRYDDAADIQGQWKVEGTTGSIVITNSEIRLTDSVTYGYELDTFNKTITYSFGSYSNTGTYEFSEERDVLTLTDVDQDAMGNAIDSSLNLLKISSSTTGEPETVANNTTEDANTVGAAVVSNSSAGSSNAASAE
jgi:hypothetical protein